jgi:hypothetical protein
MFAHLLEEVESTGIVEKKLWRNLWTSQHHGGMKRKNEGETEDE